jgi:hypothetical protein
VRAQTRTVTCAGVAGLAVLFGFACQALTVARNYHGDWTGLYCIGATRPAPSEMSGMYRFPESRGFDGQMYLMIALDPLFRHGNAAYVDEPALRYRRILLPATANIVALGNARAIVYSYILVNLGFLFLGAWWLSMSAVLNGRHPAWGWMFLAVPGVLISLDRQTVDMALTALALGAMYAWQTKRWRLLFVLLPLLCLVRETGLVIVGGFLLAFLFQRRWKYAALCVLATAPFIVWSWVVDLHFPPMLREWLTTNPFAWTIHALLHPPLLPFSTGVRNLVECIDLLALSGFLMGAAISLRACIRTRWTSGPMLSSALIAALCVYLFSLDEWTHVYDYGRIASPMAALLMTDSTSGWLRYLPSVLMSSRVIVQLAPQALRVMGVHV